MSRKDKRKSRYNYQQGTKVDKKTKEKPKKRNYSIVRYTSSDYIPLQKLDLFSKIRMTFRFMFDKKYKEVNLRKKRIAQEKEYHDKLVILRNFLNSQLALNNSAKKVYIQIDKKFLPVLDDVLGTINPEWFPTPVKINPNILKYIRVPHILILFEYIGDYDITDIKVIKDNKPLTLSDKISEILSEKEDE